VQFLIRDASSDDGAAMLALLPRLADFNYPPYRDPAHLWQHDAALLRNWLAGDAPQCLVQVAVGDGEVIGLTLTSLRPDPLSDEPAAHLEAIAVASRAEGAGAGKALLQAAEQNAVAHGARSFTLHVIATNDRARRFYEHCGYYGELLRYIKPLGG
jgi:ribosomal protein S18 acetylase RimI-like enzyme